MNPYLTLDDILAEEEQLPAPLPDVLPASPALEGVAARVEVGEHSLASAVPALVVPEGFETEPLPPDVQRLIEQREAIARQVDVLTGKLPSPDEDPAFLARFPIHARPKDDSASRQRAKRREPTPTRPVHPHRKEKKDRRFPGLSLDDRRGDPSPDPKARSRRPPSLSVGGSPLQEEATLQPERKRVEQNHPQRDRKGGAPSDLRIGPEAPPRRSAADRPLRSLSEEPPLRPLGRALPVLGVERVGNKDGFRDTVLTSQEFE